MSDRQVDIRAPQPVAEQEESLGQLFGQLTRELSELMRQEMALAKTELKEEATKAGRTAGLFGGAAVTGHMCLLLLSFAAAWGLAVIMPTGVAFLIVGLIYAVVAAFLFVRARAEVKRINPVPEQTIETLKEDVQWAKAQPR
jgi:hypothetical protein